MPLFLPTAARDARVRMRCTAHICTASRENGPHWGPPAGILLSRKASKAEAPELLLSSGADNKAHHTLSNGPKLMAAAQKFNYGFIFSLFYLPQPQWKHDPRLPPIPHPVRGPVRNPRNRPRSPAPGRRPGIRTKARRGTPKVLRRPHPPAVGVSDSRAAGAFEPAAAAKNTSTSSR